MAFSFHERLTTLHSAFQASHELEFTVKSHFDAGKYVKPHLKFTVSTDTDGSSYKFLDYEGRRLHVWVTMGKDVELTK